MYGIGMVLMADVQSDMEAKGEAVVDVQTKYWRLDVSYNLTVRAASAL